MHLFNQLHPDWQLVLSPYQDSILKIEHLLKNQDISPDRDLIFRSLTKPIAQAKVVIFGQDPYPTLGHAHGLAFSVDRSVNPLPPTLRNIFKEFCSDLGRERTSGDLSDWFEQGVLLINRVLTVQTGESMQHANIGWQEITDAVAQELGKRDVVAILWGKSAGELSKFFRPEWQIESVHPSPLSAYRGFFGSKPFTAINAILIRNQISAIDW